MQIIFVIFSTRKPVTVVSLKFIIRFSVKAPMTTAEDDSLEYFFINFQRKSDLIFHLKPLLGRGFI